MESLANCVDWLLALAAVNVINMLAPHVALWEKKKERCSLGKQKKGRRGEKKVQASVALYAFAKNNAQAESGRLDTAGWVCSGRPGAVALIPPA